MWSGTSSHRLALNRMATGERLTASSERRHAPDVLAAPTASIVDTVMRRESRAADDPMGLSPSALRAGSALLLLLFLLLRSITLFEFFYSTRGHREPILIFRKLFRQWPRTFRSPRLLKGPSRAVLHDKIGGFRPIPGSDAIWGTVAL